MAKKKPTAEEALNAILAAGMKSPDSLIREWCTALATAEPESSHPERSGGWAWKDWEDATEGSHG